MSMLIALYICMYIYYGTAAKSIAEGCNQWTNKAIRGRLKGK